jgi:Hypothetical glycosyl hydrolase family 15
VLAPTIRNRFRIIGVVAILALVGLGFLLSGTERKSASAVNARASFDQFTRISYDNSTTPPDAAKFRSVILEDASPALVHSIRTADSNTKVFDYFSWWMLSAHPAGPGLCFPVRDGALYGVPGSYLLHDSSGTVLGSNGTYYLDVANPAVQRACLNQMINQSRAGGYSGVMLDVLNLYPSLGPDLSCPGGSATCATVTGWHHAFQSFLTYLASGLHSKGLLLLGNVAGIWGPGEQPVWDTWAGILDGSIEESWAFGTDHQPIAPSRVALDIHEGRFAEHHRKLLIANADIAGMDSTAATAYGLALALMVASGQVSWDVSEGSYTTYERWFSVYDAARALGPPRGPATYDTTTSTYSRRFRNGTVTANIATHVGAIP